MRLSPLKKTGHSKRDYRDESLTIQVFALRAGGTPTAAQRLRHSKKTADQPGPGKHTIFVRAYSRESFVDAFEKFCTSNRIVSRSHHSPRSCSFGAAMVSLTSSMLHGANYVATHMHDDRIMSD